MIFRYGKTSVKNTLLARNLNRNIAFNDHNSLLNGFNGFNNTYSNNINLIIINCPKLEFIEYYDKFTITIDHKKVFRIKQDDLSKIKEEIDEIKSLLKDQQEYAHIIQSLLKRINKLENKPLENK